MKRILGLLMILVLCAAAGFSVAENGEWVIDAAGVVKEYNGPGGEVAVPAEINGIPVVTVDSGLFYGRNDIISVVFPEGMLFVTNVLNTAETLEKVELPSTLQTIDSGFLVYVPKLKELVIPASVLYIDSNFLSAAESLEKVVFNGWCPVIRDAGSVLTGIAENGVILVPDDQLDAYRAALSSVDPAKIQPSGQEADTAPALDFQLYVDAEGTLYDCVTTGTWVEIPAEYDGVKIRKIGDYAFQRCTNLYCVGIPEGVEEIGTCAFGRLNHLGYVVMPDSVQVIGPEAFQFFKGYTIHWPASLREIGDKAFNGSKIAGPVEFPEGLVSIGEQAFRNAPIRELYLPAGLESIGANAFEGRMLNYIWLDSGVLPEIGADAFKNQPLEDVDLRWNASKEQMLTAQAFFESQGLNPRVWRCQNPEVEYPEDGTITFDPEHGWMTGYTGTKTNIRPFDSVDGVDTTGLADGAFRGDTQILYFAACYNDLFTYIGKEAFKDSALERVDLFDSVTEIGDDAFNGSRLKAVTLPESLVSVGERAFANCGELTEVTILCDPAVLPASAFEGCNAVTRIRTKDDNGEDSIRLAERLGIDIPGLRPTPTPSPEPTPTPTPTPAPTAEPAPEPTPEPVPASEEEYARFGGVWTMTAITEDGQTFDPAEFGVNFTMALYPDGTVRAETPEGVEQGRWRAEGEDRIRIIENTESVAVLRDGQLAVDAGDGAVMILTRTGEPGTEPEPDGPVPYDYINDPPVTLPPVPDGPEGIRTEVKYVAVTVEVGGRTLNAADYGMDYSLLLHADGSVELVFVGTPVEGLTWHGEAGDVLLDFMASVLGRCTPEGNGLAMDYTGTMTIHMEPEN